VLHYDLPWNPNRLEQREGRIDRFGQPKAEVRAIVLFSEDNPIDGVVLNVLIRKARQIYRDLGISVPVPADSESVMKAVVKAVFEGWRGQDEQQLRLDLPEVNTVKAFHENWQHNADREERRRSRFAQHAIKPDEVAREIEATDTVLGDPEAIRHFMVNRRFAGGNWASHSADRRRPGSQLQDAGPRGERMLLLRREIAGDVQDQLRQVRSICVDIAVAGGHDRHVRRDRPIGRVQG